MSLGASQFIDKFWRTNDLRCSSLEEAREMCAGAICCLAVHCMLYQDSASSEHGRSEAVGSRPSADHGDASMLRLQA